MCGVDKAQAMKALAWVVGAAGVMLGGALAWRVITYWGTTPGATAEYWLLLGSGVGIACLGLIVARGLVKGQQWAVATTLVLGIMLAIVAVTWLASLAVGL